MPSTQKIAPCLWFDSQAEEAAKYYCGIFKNSRIVKVSHYTKAGQEVHGRPPGSGLNVAVELYGRPFPVGAWERG
jgi:predicted 3-demethylubiquinone-9 3-methyltransferase (glyoxalase superfamily)